MGATPYKQKWGELSVVLFGQSRQNRGKLKGILIAHIRWVSTGTKYVAYAIKTASGKTVNLTVKLVGNIVDFGRSYDLRKALDLAIGNPLQAHHLIAWEYRGHQVIQEVARNAKKGKDFFHMNHPNNGFIIEASRNQPNHPLYNARVKAGLDKIQQTFGLNNPSVLKIELEKFENFLRNTINSNPNVHLNDIIFDYIP